MYNLHIDKPSLEETEASEVVVDIMKTLFYGKSDRFPWKGLKTAVMFVSYDFSVTLGSVS